MKNFYLLLLAFVLSQDIFAQKPFITTWDLATPGSGATKLSFGVATTDTVNYTWTTIPAGKIGSGTLIGTTATITDLPVGATIELSIAPTNFQRINIDSGADKSRLIDVKQWGDVAWTSMQSAFHGCNKMQINATDTPNLSAVTNMANMFNGAKSFNQNIGAWNTSAVTNMIGMFAGATSFNQNISAWNTAAVKTMSYMFVAATSFNQNIGAWNTSAVTDMANMFYRATSFNQNISTWNTSAVTNMSSMFSGVKSFNQNISNWNTSAVTDMASMFSGATSFNQDISAWNTSAVTDMRSMFERAISFNQNISAWNTSAVTSMSGMFSEATSFNQNIDNWNISAVTYMSGMFQGATSFNQNISTWNTANVTSMYYMFSGATSFNQNISDWNVINVTDMVNMFKGAISFNQNISDWNVINVTDMVNMFKGATSFNQNLAVWGTKLNPNVDLANFLDNCGMDVNNYDATLTGFNVSKVTGRNMGALDLKYCASAADRANLVKSLAEGGKGWKITGDVACISATDDVNNTALLHQNRPNPFSEKTIISFDLLEMNNAVLTVFDINGKQIFSLNKTLDAGYNEVILDKTIFKSTGIYFYRLSSKNNYIVKKLDFIAE